MTVDIDASRGTIEVRVADGVGWIVLDRPPLNIISTSMCRAITAAVADLDGDPDVRIIVLTSRGERAFAAGSDIGEHSVEAVREHSGAIFSMIRALIAEDGKPRIAAVKGICSGGGLELSYACDFVVARADTRFALPEIEIGVANVLAPYLIAAHANPAFAFSRALSGTWFDAEEARRQGMVVEILPVEGYEAALHAWLQRFATKSGAALRIGRKLYRRVQNRCQQEALDRLERDLMAEAVTTEDYAEGVAAFFDKRSPRWRHR